MLEKKIIIKKEPYIFNPIKAYFVSLSFLTRFPQITHQNPARAIWMFPVAGFLIGLMHAGIYRGLDIFFSPFLAAFIAMMVLIWVTAGLHEDGLADWVDAMGSARCDRKNRIRIMHDPQIGSFGAIVLFFSIILRALMLIELSPSDFFLWAIAISHAGSRGVLAVIMKFLQVIPESKLAKSFGELHFLEVFLAILFSLMSLFLLQNLWMIFGGICVFFLLAFAGCFLLKRSMGGYNGDGLGACQQFSEIILLIMLSIFIQIEAFI